MLTKLHLKGFQKHKDVVLDFDQVTTIVGPTDSGKSSVVRALRWLFLAAPATSAAPVAGGDAYAAATVENRKVARRKGDENVYYLDDQEFRAFRTTVPEPIAAALSVQPVNFQSQHDSMYWLSSSSPEVSRQLNELVDLEIIDETLGRVGAQVRKSTTLFEDSEGTLFASLAEFKVAREQREAVVDFAEVQRLQKDLAEKEARLQKFAPIVTGFEEAYATWTSAMEHADAIEEVRYCAQAYGSRRNLFSSIKNHIEEIEALKETITRYKDVPGLGPLESLVDEIESTADRIELLEEAVLAHRKHTNVIAKYENISTEELDTLASEFQARNKILVSLSESIDRVVEAEATVLKFEGLSFAPIAEEWESIRVLSRKIETVETAVDEHTLDLLVVQRLGEEIARLSKDLKGTCFECGRPYE
jgi:chromosome segregation ATPase